MTQTQERETVPVAERAELIASRAGEQLGRLAGRAGVRVQQAAHAIREGAERMGTRAAPAPREGEAAVQQVQETPPATERAEALVDQFGQRVSHWALESNLRVRKATARLREDAEDLWVEAQEKCHEWEGKGRGKREET